MENGSLTWTARQPAEDRQENAAAQSIWRKRTRQAGEHQRRIAENEQPTTRRNILLTLLGSQMLNAGVERNRFAEELRSGF